MKLILEAIKSLLRPLKNSIHVTQKAVADVDAKANRAKEVAYYAEDVANEAYGRAINAQETASNAQTTASNAQAAVEDKLDNLNPSGTGVFSMNRKANTTIGSRSTAMGNATTASGTYATAMGDTTTSSGRSSTAMGNTTTASGNYSIAMGNTTKAQRRSQHVQGEFNLLDTYGSTSTRGKYAHIVGNGTSDTARSNAHTLDWNGLGWFAGGLKVGGTGQDDANAKEVATKDDKLPNPHALIFTGAVEGTYDGSEPMTVEIPQGGSGGGSASVGGNMRFVRKLVLTEASDAVVLDTDNDGNPFSLKEFVIFILAKVSAASKITYIPNGHWVADTYLNSTNSTATDYAYRFVAYGYADTDGFWGYEIVSKDQPAGAQYITVKDPNNYYYHPLTKYRINGKFVEGAEFWLYGRDA